MLLFYKKFLIILYSLLVVSNSYASETNPNSNKKFQKAFEDLPYYNNLYIPLEYSPTFGVYTTNIQINEKMHLIDVIIDTGSPLLVILGNSKICPSCKPYITKGKIPDDFNISTKPKAKILDYGTESDLIVKEKLKVNFHKYNTPIEFNSHIITKGNNTSNILGIAPLPDEYKDYSYLKNLLDIMHFKEQFTFLICGNDNNNLIVGDYLPKDSNNNPLSKTESTALGMDAYYTLQLSGIRDEKENPLIMYYSDNYAKAILDSGTGGLIVLPNDTYPVIIKYIKESYENQNTLKILNDDFWFNNYCVKSSFINSNYFPDLKFTFPSFYNPNENISLTLTPEKYITEGGCGKNFKRLSFAHHDNYIKNAPHKKFTSKITTDYYIFGTPLFEQYGITFNLENKPYVNFFNKYFSCEKIN